MTLDAWILPHVAFGRRQQVFDAARLSLLIVVEGRLDSLIRGVHREAAVQLVFRTTAGPSRSAAWSRPEPSRAN